MTTPQTDAELIEIIRSRATPLEAQPTCMSARVGPINDIRAVLFDIYGTLIISGVGDIGTSADDWKDDALRAAWDSAGGSALQVPEEAPRQLEQAIRDQQAGIRAEGEESPEIDIDAIWAQLAKAWGDPGVDPRRMAVEFESRVNPTWPMPHARELLGELQEAGITQGIISNAQFFTPLLFEALFDRSVSDFGFDDGLCFYSFEYNVAKPGSTLFRLAARSLDAKGFSPAEVLYIGNDMLNDMTPAKAAGFRTALFAGDARSLRLRESDPRVDADAADLVLTDLAQLREALSLSSDKETPAELA